MRLWPSFARQAAAGAVCSSLLPALCAAHQVTCGYTADMFKQFTK